ncbi:MAG: hypothetical protein JWN34_1537 [Bryobacterales bacterium]|nr:hypothetical protein [Bryobacterales bacterium]
MQNFLSGIVLGVMLMAALLYGVDRATRVNISDADLYRFCLLRSIPLEKCIIEKPKTEQAP